MLARGRPRRRDRSHRITCPIGLPTIDGKEPAVIAVGVAAALVAAMPSMRPELVDRASTSSARTPSTAPTAAPWSGRHDPVPRHRHRRPRRPVRRRPGAAAPGRRRRRPAGPRRRHRRPAGRSPRSASPSTRDEEVVDLRGGVLLPGFVDTHVHFPQVRAIGGLGMPLLDWLQRCALPEEVRLGRPALRRGGGRGVPERAGDRGHHHGAGLRLPLRRGDGRAVRRGRGRRGCGSPPARCSATGCCPRPC